jgi:hypothetical protein
MRSLFPSHDVIVLSKPSSFAEVGMASLMFAEANMDSFLHQHRNQPVSTEVPVRNNDVPSFETRQELAKHSDLASVFPLIRPDRSIHYASCSQMEQRNHTSDRESQAWLLGGMLGICRLILGRIGHFEGKTIDQQRIAFFPSPRLFLGL